MRIVAVYKEFSEHGREMEDYIRDFERQTGSEIEPMDPEKAQNEFFLQAYDIVEYPTILALSDDGSLLHQWRGRPLPLIDEVANYSR